MIRVMKLTWDVKEISEDELKEYEDQGYYREELFDKKCRDCKHSNVKDEDYPCIKCIKEIYHEVSIKLHWEKRNG
jgi:hypothetical protein